MIESLEQLTQYIRETVPQSKTITHLKPVPEADAISFHWQGREFVVKRTLEVLELKGKQVFLTGASMLMQIVLTHRNRNERTIEGIVAALRESEDLIANKTRSQAGMQLLKAAKATLAKLARVSTRKKKPSPAAASPAPQA